MSAETYATIEDLENYWDGYTDGMAAKAQQLLEYSSAYIRQLFKRQMRDLNEEIADNEVEEVILKTVVMDMTVRVLNSESDKTLASALGQGFTSYSEHAGPYSITLGGGNGTTGVFLKKSEKLALGLDDFAITSIKIY